MNDGSVSPENDPRRIDYRTVSATLRAGNATPEWFGRWLPVTYAAPELFNEALYAHARRRSGGLKSVAGASFDFFHDCVSAHLGQARPALIVRSAGRDLELSFGELDARSSGSAFDASDASGAAAGSAGAAFVPARRDVPVGAFEPPFAAGLGSGAPRLNAAMRSSTSGSAGARPGATSVS